MGRMSNTAVPRYYGEFRDRVLRKEINVCETISMQMNLIDDLIRNPGVWYDPVVVEGFISFCEHEMVLTDGSDVKLLDSFKLWGEDLFGWYYFEYHSVYVPSENNHGGHYVQKKIKKRLRTKQFLIVARGAAKSIYASFVQAYALVTDTHTTEQITTAPTMAQADEILSPIRTAIIKSRGPVFKFMTSGSVQNTRGSRTDKPKLFSTKKGIENALTNSTLSIKPMRIDKLQGLRCRYATLDEWLSCPIREDPIGAIEQGARKGGDDQYIILATSSEGTIRNGVGDDMKLELMQILRGEYVNPHVSIWYYKLDDISEVGNPEMWIKANPNIGQTVTYETYQLDVERAEKNPAARNDILAKRFNLPMEGYTYFFTYEETLPHREQNYWGQPCSLGVDLSRGDDFCSFTFLFPLGSGRFGIKTRNYITSSTLHKLTPSLYSLYQTFIQEGSLIIMEGVTLDMLEVFDDLDDFITSSKYEVQCLGYDPYNAKDFIAKWEIENGSFGIEKVIQGARTESVPLGELKKMAEDRLLIFDQQIMQFTMGNCIALVDTNGNRKLLKDRNEQKIDAVAALMDAYVAYKIYREVF